MPLQVQPATLLSPSSGHPTAIAVRDERTALNWIELEVRARRFASGLRDLGLRPGDRWAILSSNRIEWAEAILGSIRAGTKCVPVNWHLSPAEVGAMLEDAGVRLLFVDPEHDDLARRAAATATRPIDVITFNASYEMWLASNSDEPLETCTAGSILQYTGGTTGPSRGVDRAERSGLVHEFVERSSTWPDLVGMPRHGAVLLATPAYHALGGAILRSALARGLPLTMLDRWNPIETLATIERDRISATAMVPTQFIRLLKLESNERDRYDLSSLEWLLHTAAPCPAWAKYAMIDWLGPVVVELYGSSEGAGPVVCTSDEWLARPGTVGRAVGALRLSIVGEDGEDLGPGEVGTIYAHRPDGPPTYHGDEEKSRAIRLSDDRFTVGDIGWLDEDGFLFLADRRIDLVIRAGTNIYPAEIEAVLTEHPAVADVAVFGVPDPEWGQAIVALVEPASPDGDRGVVPTSEELVEFCRSRLAVFKVPQVVEMRAALPREASGKLKKRLLREEYIERISAAER